MKVTDTDPNLQKMNIVGVLVGTPHRLCVVFLAGHGVLWEDQSLCCNAAHREAKEDNVG